MAMLVLQAGSHAGVYLRCIVLKQCQPCVVCLRVCVRVCALTVLDLSQGAPLSSNGAEVTTPDLTLGALSPYKPSDKTTSLPPTSVFRTTTLPHGLGAASGAIGLSPSAAGFLEAQNATLLEKLMAAEQRAKSAEQQVEQVKDQIQTMQFGDMLQEVRGCMVSFRARRMLQTIQSRFEDHFPCLLLLFVCVMRHTATQGHVTCQLLNLVCPCMCVCVCVCVCVAWCQ